MHYLCCIPNCISLKPYRNVCQENTNLGYLLIIFSSVTEGLMNQKSLVKVSCNQSQHAKFEYANNTNEI